MADDDIINLSLICLLLLVSLSSASDNELVIRSACNASRCPLTCQSLLSGNVYPSNATTPLQVIQSAVRLVTKNLKSGEDKIHALQLNSTHNVSWSNTATSCLDVIEYSENRLKQVNSALKKKPELTAGSRKMKDVRMWLSAVLGYLNGCLSGLKYVGVDTTVAGANASSFFNLTLIPIARDALGMLFNYDDVSGATFKNWGPPRTERNGFWEPLDAGFSGWAAEAEGALNKLTADVTVCKSGCNFNTIQGAVNATKDNLRRHGKRFVILIKAGVYNETVRVRLNKTNVVLLGEGIGKTVIIGSHSVGLENGTTTHNSAVVGVAGDGFMARDLTIWNNASAGGHQAVAFRSDSDESLLLRCEFIGNQDTLNSGSLRQYYMCCVIKGNVDFIFGNSAAVFQDCTVLVAPLLIEPEKGEKNTVTAHGRIDGAQTTGFVFWNSLVNGTEEYMKLYYNNTNVHLTFLGRPWKEFSRTVFIDCTLEALISPEGWLRWKDGDDFALPTLYYGEFNNSGPGSDTTNRANWSSLIPKEHVKSYIPHYFIQA